MRGVKWGIVGFGSFADAAMVPAIAGTEGHELGAIVSRSKDRAKTVAVPVIFPGLS